MALGKLEWNLHIVEGNLLPIDLNAPFIILAAGHEVGTVRGTVDAHFALGSTTNRADILSSGWTEPLYLPLTANRTGQWELPAARAPAAAPKLLLCHSSRGLPAGGAATVVVSLAAARLPRPRTRGGSAA